MTLPDLASLERAAQAAQENLDASKARCAALCDDPAAALTGLEPSALAAAAAANHVARSLARGADPSIEAASGGRMVDQAHLVLVAKAAAAAREGQDPAAAIGADPSHVALIDAAAAAHASHQADLEAAYQAFAHAAHELAEGREHLDAVARVTALGLTVSGGDA